MYQRVDPNGPFLHVPLREKIPFRETVEDEGQVCDRGRVGCEVKLKPSLQPVVVHFMFRKRKKSRLLRFRSV